MNFARATRSNPFYARRYRWNRWRSQIAGLIGSGNSTIESRQFATAVKNWQQSVGLVPADGMLGPETWHRMAREIPGAEAISSDSPGAPLRIVSRQGGYLVLNRDAFRREVVQFLWGGSFTPTNEELHSRSTVEYQSELDLELPDTHWMLPHSRFAALVENAANLFLIEVRDHAISIILWTSGTSPIGAQPLKCKLVVRPAISISGFGACRGWVCSIASYPMR